MFGNGFLSGWRLKTMSAFTASVMASTSMLFAGDPQIIINEVKSELRTDGLSFSYEANEAFDDDAEYEKLFKSSASSEIKQVIKFYREFSKISKETGLKDLDGYGSSIAKNGKLYDMDLFFHLKKGNEKSLLWKFLGGEAKKLETFELLPENTILASTSRINLKAVWDYLKKTLPDVHIPDAPNLAEELTKLEKMASGNGIPVEAVVKALSTEVSLFVTMNKDRTMKLPNMPELPQMGLSLIMKKKSDFIQNYLLMLLSNAPTQKLKIGSYEIVTINQMLPTGTKAGIAYDDEHFIISSDIKVVQNILKAKAGKSLVNSEKFQKYASLKRTGNSAFYVSSEISEEVSDLKKALPSEIGLAISGYSISFFQDKTPELFSVVSKKKNGMKLDMLSTFNLPTTTSTTMIAVAVVGVLAAMILPALGNARKKAKMASSKSNLKQMGTTVAVYFSDGVASTFPKDFKKMEFDESIFSHPEGTGADSLDDVFKGLGDYIPVYKVGGAYQGSSDKALFIERPGIWPNGVVHVVYEDGHVDSVIGFTKKDVMEQLNKN